MKKEVGDLVSVRLVFNDYRIETDYGIIIEIGKRRKIRKDFFTSLPENMCKVFWINNSFGFNDTTEEDLDVLTLVSKCRKDEYEVVEEKHQDKK